MGCWVFGFLLLAFFMMTAFGFLLAVRGTSTSIRVLGFFDCCGMFLCGIAVTVFSVATSQALDMANQHAIYPQPSYSIGWMVAVGLCIPMALIQSCLCMDQYKKAR